MKSTSSLLSNKQFAVDLTTIIMKLALASSLLSVVCFPEEVAAFTASRTQIAAVRSSSYAQQLNNVALQAVTKSNSDDESNNNQQLNRRDALFRFAAATTTALISGSQIAVADDEVTSAAAAPAAVVESASSSATSNTLTVAKEDDFKSAPPAAAPKDVELKVAMEKSPASPVVAKQPMDDSKLVAKMEEEIKAPVVAKKEVDIKVAALEKDVKEAPVVKNETKLFAKMTDDADSASTLLVPTAKKSAIKASSTPDSVATAVASAGAKTSATVLAALDAPGAGAKSIDKNVVGGAVAFAGLLALAGIASNSDEEMTDLPTGTAAPGGLPYGLDGGRNFGEAPEKPPATAPPPAPSIFSDPAWLEGQEKFKESMPQPYGMINKNTNPFIKDMYEYCEGGKVSEKCTETITEYMEDIANTGAVASDEEVETITSYMDSLVPTSSQTGSTGAAIAGYLDALSVGTAPGPKNAKAVATYLDTLGGSSGEIPKPFAKRFTPTGKSKPTPVAAKPAPVAAAPAPVVEKSTPVAAAPVAAAPVPAAPSPDFSKFDSRLKEIESQSSSTTSMIQQYDSRLDTIETRVTSLESKVDAVPDQVFQKMEAWQSKADLKLSEEVKKIISVLTPEAQEPPATPAPVAPVAPPPAPVPAPVAPVASSTASTPAAATMPNSMLASNAAPAGPKKSYGLGNASWKK